MLIYIYIYMITIMKNKIIEVMKKKKKEIQSVEERKREKYLGRSNTFLQKISREVE